MSRVLMVASGFVLAITLIGCSNKESFDGDSSWRTLSLSYHVDLSHAKDKSASDSLLIHAEVRNKGDADFDDASIYALVECPRMSKAILHRFTAQGLMRGQSWTVDTALAIENIDAKDFHVQVGVDTLSSYQRVYLFPVIISGKWGYVDTVGGLAINPIFASAGYFVGELAAVSVKNDGVEKWGLINQSGKFVIQPNFDWIAPTQNGLAIARVANGKDTTYGYVGSNSQYVINPTFQDGSSFSANGLATAKVSGKYGYIDKVGRFVINPQFEMARQFWNGLAAVRVNKYGESKWGYIDEAGKMVIEAQFEFAGDFSSKSDLALVSIGSGLQQRFGFISKEGKYLIPPSYSAARPFSEGLAGVSTVDIQSLADVEQFTMGCINTHGQICINPQYTTVEPFLDGLAVAGVYKKGVWKYLFIDKNGKQVGSSDYLWASGFNKGITYVTSNIDKVRKISLLNTSLKTIWGPADFK